MIGNILKNFVRVQANNWSLLLGWTGISFDGESDKNLQKDIERLSQSNEYLIQAIDRLGEKMDDSPGRMCHPSTRNRKNCSKRAGRTPPK